MVLGSKSKVARGSKFMLNFPKQVLSLCPALYVYIIYVSKGERRNDLSIETYMYQYLCLSYWRTNLKFLFKSQFYGPPLNPHVSLVYLNGHEAEPDIKADIIHHIPLRSIKCM